MNETKAATGFIGYEYKEVIINREVEHLYIDQYPNFGWTLESITHSGKGPLFSALRFKRDRSLGKNMELTRLQRQFETGVKDIRHLEVSKQVTASAAAYATGIAGTGFMTGATFSYLNGSSLLCILLAVPAFIGWVLPYFLFVRIRDKKIEDLTPLIDKQYEMIYTVCEKAYSLLTKV